MLHLLIDAFILCVSFVAGAIVGLNNKPTVEAAITALKAAEADAKTVLAKITTHKAN